MKLSDDILAQLGTALKGTIRERAGGSDDLSGQLCALIDTMPGHSKAAPAVKLHSDLLFESSSKPLCGLVGWSESPPGEGKWAGSRQGAFHGGAEPLLYGELLFPHVGEKYDQLAPLRNIFRKYLPNDYTAMWLPAYFLLEAVRLNLGEVPDAPSAELTASSDFMNWIGQLKGYVQAAAMETYAWVLQNKYEPTTLALKEAIGSDQGAEARQHLESAIMDGRFTTQVQIMLQSDPGGDVLWFLFNLWVFLLSLGENDVSAKITEFKNAGLPVPDQVGPDHWSRTYSDWSPYGEEYFFNRARDYFSATTMTVQWMVQPPYEPFQSTYSPSLAFRYKFGRLSERYGKPAASTEQNA
ncbi:hypothetical protein ACIO1C_05400 [Streptomyces sp. NPDC087420]|uniref:hypothetical protein n=1 Tax=Streptomyces sp. NPDC087420 TaxID=3365785 RepID=UPI0038363659